MTVTDLLLERYLADDLPTKTRRHIEGLLQQDVALRERFEALRAERAAFLAAAPPEAFAHRVASTVAATAPARRPLWQWLVAPSFAGATVVVVAIVVQRPPPDAPALPVGEPAALAPSAAPAPARDEGVPQEPAVGRPPFVAPPPQPLAHRSPVKSRAPAKGRAADVDGLLELRGSGADSGHSAVSTAPAGADGGHGAASAAPAGGVAKAEERLLAPAAARRGEGSVDDKESKADAGLLQIDVEDPHGWRALRRGDAVPEGAMLRVGFAVTPGHAMLIQETTGGIFVAFGQGQNSQAVTGGRQRVVLRTLPGLQRVVLLQDDQAFAKPASAAALAGSGRVRAAWPATR